MGGEIIPPGLLLLACPSFIISILAPHCLPSPFSLLGQLSLTCVMRRLEGRTLSPSRALSEVAFFLHRRPMQNPGEDKPPRRSPRLLARWSALYGRQQRLQLAATCSVQAEA